MMDDVLPGVIIDGVLGVDLTEVNEFMAQMDPQFSGTSADLKERAQQVRVLANLDQYYYLVEFSIGYQTL